MKRINAIRSNRSGKFKGNYNNRIVIAETEDKRPTKESIFNITFIARVNGIATRVTKEVFASEITFFHILN